MTPPAPATAAARRRRVARGAAAPRRVSGPAAPPKRAAAPPKRAVASAPKRAAAPPKRAAAAGGKALGLRKAAPSRVASPRPASARARAGAKPHRHHPLAGRVAAVAQAAAALPLRDPAPAPARPRRAPRAVPRPSRRDLPRRARIAGWVRALPDHRLLDRLIGGRIWIVLVCTLLVGLVTLQLSLLKLNAGIGAAVERSAQLEERNAALRVANSRLTDSERIVELGSRMGLVMPPQGSPRFRAVTRGDVSAAVSTMRAPDPALAAAATDTYDDADDDAGAATADGTDFVE